MIVSTTTAINATFRSLFRRLFFISSDMYPSLDPEDYPGTPEYQEYSEHKARKEQARHDMQIEQLEADRYYCRRF